MSRWMRAGASVCVAASLGAAADVVQVKERSYVVKYADNVAERYSVKWTLDVASNMRDEGGSFVPYQGNVETRRCRWSVTSAVDRTVALATRLGQTIALADMSRKLTRNAEKPGRELIVEGERGETCSKVRAQVDGEVARAGSAALEGFEKLTNEDLESLGKEARSKAGVLTVTVE